MFLGVCEHVVAKDILRTPSAKHIASKCLDLLSYVMCSLDRLAYKLNIYRSFDTL